MALVLTLLLSVGCSSVNTLKSISFDSGVLLKEQVLENEWLGKYTEEIKKGLQITAEAADAASDYDALEQSIDIRLQELLLKIPVQYRYKIRAMLNTTIAAVIEQLKLYDEEHPQQVLTRKNWAEILNQLVAGYFSIE